LYSNLADYLKHPTLYERTIEKFWDDPYIAAQMLDAHLDSTTDAASRNLEFITRCADWVASLLPNSAELLDIGCGPGLYTKKFAERSLQVTGLDFSASSIAYARTHDSDSEYVFKDYLSMDFDNMFDIITLIYCDYGALIPDEHRNLLRRINKALRPGGLFLLDVFTPQKCNEKHDNTSWDIHPDGGFWSPNPHICLNAGYFYGEVAEISRHVIIEENSIRCFNLWDCYFTKQTLLNEVSAFGFSDGGFYSDVTGQPYADDSETLCAILKKEKNND